MRDPITQIFSMASFEKYAERYGRGYIPQDAFFTEFIHSFDPDSLPECLSLMDDRLKVRIQDFVDSSPTTNQDWIELRLQHRKRADAVYEANNYELPSVLADRQFIMDMDGSWKSMPRFAVLALRNAFELQVAQDDWGDWCNRNQTLIAQSGLNPWVFENRVRWYAYLNSSSTPRYRFENCPVDDISSNSQTALNEILARIQLVDQNHPDYFYNARASLIRLLRHKWGLL